MDDHNNDEHSNKLLVVVGPTAVGKTALSLSLATRFNGEIISADSRLFYRGMDIGTDKPPQEVRARVRHYMIDICEPNETVTLGQYVREAKSHISKTHRRGKVPILVGGTGQYIRAITEGWSIPEVAPQPELRLELDRLDNQELYRWLLMLDPDSANRIDPQNKRRIVRALEVTIVTGHPMSKLQQKVSPGYDLKVIGLTCDREVLYQRIDERVSEMMDEGFLMEVERLRRSGYGRELPALSGLGYRQLLAYLDGEYTLDEAIERIMFETHRFARQQYNWFRIDNHEIDWFDVKESSWQEKIHDEVRGWVE